LGFVNLIGVSHALSTSRLGLADSLPNFSFYPFSTFF
jgi:hypothetical protein